jgi:BlaI family transcriptional regulator, penicillinase repressor
MKLDRITDGELSILQVLWDRGEATSREITTALHEEVTDPKMASVQKLIERLEAKGCVERDRSERAHRFRPLVSHERFLRSRLQSLANRLCDGAVVPLVTTLLRSERLPKRQREELRKLVDDLWPSKEPGHRRPD